MNATQRDGLVSIGGTALIVGFFVLAVYLPGERGCQAARREIALANQTIDAMPQRIQQAANQQQHSRSREELVKNLNRLLSDENELHQVLQKVADLVRASGLHVEKIQPQSPTNHATYRVASFQLAVAGNFRRIAQFLHGLESQSTLFAVDRFTLKSEEGQRSERLRADIAFSVYIKRESFDGPAEKSDRPGPAQADETQRN